MKGLDDVIKKSLLNMKYDTKKTLFENKIVLSEEETRSEMSYDGSAFDLSVNATNVVYIKSCDSFDYESPVRRMFCDWAIKKNTSDLPYKNFDECYEVTTEYVKNKLCKVGGVYMFNFGGHEFTPCVSYHDGKNPNKLPELVKFTGYFDTKATGDKKGACGSLQYFPEMFEKENEKVKKEKEVNQTTGPNVKTNVIDTKKQSSGSSGSDLNSLNVIVIDDF